jgi:hypothetical protein
MKFGQFTKQEDHLHSKEVCGLRSRIRNYRWAHGNLFEITVISRTSSERSRTAYEFTMNGGMESDL